ncbi:Hsp70 family protein [Rhodococcus ruber]|uniref:Hsp70 family protein n=1 Tax=Rhodococcus ruber TaxID=1830 RepID=A0ABT4MJM2_9NOCA|nr:Hsp70 family protein [Rhodococcus ruber]MCZ4521192.1 Hsp70 family protein [Rhodococcus ruber]
MNHPIHTDQALGWTLAIDFGTSNTAAAQPSSRRSGVEALALTHQGNLMSSAVFVESPERIDVADVALNRAQTDPASFVASPKRLVAHGTVRLRGIDLPVSVPIAAVLHSVVERASAVHRGQRPDSLILTHPEAWSPREVGVLADAANRIGYGPDRVRTLSEPRAAAHFYSRSDRPTPGMSIAVFDFGGGTVDTAVLSATAQGTFDVVAARGDNGLGGKDLDAAIRRWVDRRLDEEDPELLRFLQTEAPLHTVRSLDDSIRRAKELLSSTESATIAVGDSRTDRRCILTLTRAEFEDLIAPEMERAVALTRATLADAEQVLGTPVEALYLTGGSSRIPAIHRALGSLGRPIATLDDPKTVVAQGALIAFGDSLGTVRPMTSPEQAARSVSPAPIRRSRARRLAAAGVTAAVAAVVVIAAVVLAPWGQDRPSAPSTIAGSPDDVTAVQNITDEYLHVLATSDFATKNSYWCAANREKKASETPTPTPSALPTGLDFTAAEVIGTAVYGDQATTRIRVRATVNGEPSPQDGDGSIIAFDFGREDGQWKICRQTFQ